MKNNIKHIIANYRNKGLGYNKPLASGMYTGAIVGANDFSVEFVDKDTNKQVHIDYTNLNMKFKIMFSNEPVIFELQGKVLDCNKQWSELSDQLGIPMHELSNNVIKGKIITCYVSSPNKFEEVTNKDGSIYYRAKFDISFIAPKSEGEIPPKEDLSDRTQTQRLAEEYGAIKSVEKAMAKATMEENIPDRIADVKIYKTEENARKQIEHDSQYVQTVKTTNGRVYYQVWTRS